MSVFAPDLDALGELAASFARAYPALAPHLAARSADPDVERLLEAFAYLTERVHKLLDESPSATQSFATLVAPELERAFPCSTVVAIASPTARRRVTAGADFDSAPIGGAACRFHAWSAFDLVPWSMEEARIAWSATEGQSLVLRLAATGDGALASLFPLRLHFTGDTRVALALQLYLRVHLARCELRVDDRVVDLGKALAAWGLRTEEALLPPEPYEHPGLRLLREYHVLPAKFAFVEIAAPAQEGTSAHVELRFFFDAQLPLEMQVTPDNIRLNCVPVTNVFETTADPISPSLERPVHVLRPAGIPLGLGEVYAVTRVTGGTGGTGGVVAEIPSWAEFEAAPPAAAFHVTERHTTIRGSEVRLSLGSPADAGVLPDYDFVSIDIQATNGALPNSLGIGDVCVSPEWQVRNIGAVTPYRPPASGEELRFRTLAMTTLAAVPLVAVEPLRTLLHVLNLHPLEDAQAARAHAQRLAAILTVNVTPGRARPAAGVDLGTVVLGHDIRITISNSGFDGEGDALVFSSVLARLFAHETAIGAFARTTVRIVETGRTFAFPALHGDRVFEE